MSGWRLGSRGGTDSLCFPLMLRQGFSEFRRGRMRAPYTGKRLEFRFKNQMLRSKSGAAGWLVTLGRCLSL